MIRVYLASEGRSELGSRSGHPVYQSDEEPGVIQALLRAVRPDGWRVVGAINWVDIPKLKVNAPDAGDAHNVLAARLHASEAGADVLAFTRDRDRREGRAEDIERAIADVEAASSPGLIGGVAVETVEGWLLALAGETKSEACRHPEKEVARLGVQPKTSNDYAAHIEKHGLARIPPDATSLLLWLERARRVLTSNPADESE